MASANEIHRQSTGNPEPGNQRTREPGNQGTRSGNQGTKELGNQGTRGPGNQGTREPRNQNQENRKPLTGPPGFSKRIEYDPPLVCSASPPYRGINVHMFRVWAQDGKHKIKKSPAFLVFFHGFG